LLIIIPEHHNFSAIFQGLLYVDVVGVNILSVQKAQTPA